MRRRKIIVYIATSADGYIARPDGNVDWLDRPAVRGDYGVAAFYRSIDTILWGRRTYEFGISHGGPFDPNVKHYVFSHDPGRLERMPGVEFATEHVPAFSKRLRATPGKDIWMMGGAALIASFLDAGEIDQFIIHVIPILIGEGIPLIAPRHRSIPLELKATRRFSDGVVRLHYAVTG
jgi:dihydrofolate reductase